MIFLMNDAVLDLDMRRLVPPMAASRFRALSLGYVMRLGRELFADRPLLHREDPERAGRLAALIVCKAPSVNAALFDAHASGCDPSTVDARLAEVGLTLMADLYARQGAEPLRPYAVDREVWGRMAA